MTEDRVTRRGSLVKLGGAAVAAVAGWKAVEAAGPASGAGPAAVASGAVSCVLALEQTEGPYYVPGDKIRKNITEGKAGVPLALKLTVVDVRTCKPIKGGAVDIWHCDAGGVYSETSVQQTESLTFLRGIQKTDAKGVATFKTIYPGWYQGRTVHIHVKVALGGNVVHTGQLYFADAMTDKVYLRSPYRNRPGRDTETDDAIYRTAVSGRRSGCPSGTGYTGSITMGVQR